MAEIYFKEGQIWSCFYGTDNIGREQNGKGIEGLRPCLIIKKFNNGTFVSLALTSTVKENKFTYQIQFNTEPKSIILSQIRTFDQRRLRYKMGKIENELLVKIKKLLFDIIS